MNIILPILIIAGITLLVMWQKRLWFFSNKKDGSGFRGGTIEERVLGITNRTRGARGTYFRIEDGANGSPKSLEAYERGMADCFRRAGCLGYTRQISHSDYIVAILKSIENDSQGMPAYRLPAGQYAGTEYDKGGYILVAGQLVFLGTPHGNVIAIPDHELEGQMEHGAAVAGYEVEHVLHGWNNAERFEETKTHGAGNGHPTIPECLGVKSVQRSADSVQIEAMFLEDYQGSAVDLATINLNARSQ